MSRPRLLDLFCGAGGAAEGYHQAGFDVVGVDIKPQPHYPFEFIKCDALDYLRDAKRLTYLLGEIDAIHASPPCQHYCGLTRLTGNQEKHPDLIEPTRALLRASRRPWVIENVVGAPLQPSLVLCGSMFGLRVRRHRLFECSHALLAPTCQHGPQGTPLGVYGHPDGAGSSRRRDKGNKGSKGDWAAGMGIDWMSARELAQAIPPAYTEFVGAQLLAVLAGAS